MAAIERGIPYYFYTPGSAFYFALNAPADAKFAGYVSDITGLDSPGVRENAQVVVAGDGGYHGPFWKDRRPWTFTGPLMPQFPLLARDNAQELIEGVIMACDKADGLLQWTPADGILRSLAFRLQQPVRCTKGQSNVQLNYNIACVSADWRIRSANLQSVVQAIAANAGTITTGLPTVNNLGNADAPWSLNVAGPTNGIVLTNNTSGKVITVNTNVGSGQSLVIDLTGAYPVVTLAGADVSGSVDPLNTDWSIAPGRGNSSWQIQTTGSSAATQATLHWYHAWI